MQPNTLVVLPYIQGKAQGSELKLALNSWKKFCQFDYHFVVIGEYSEQFPKEFLWVEFIYEKKLPNKENQYNPHLDIQHKFEIAYNKFHNDYEGFIYMVDDNYAIKPFKLSDIKTIYYHQMTFSGNKSDPVSFWKHDKWKTRQLLDREKLPHINYTAHYPCYFEFERIKELWDRFNMREESYVPEDVYYNSYQHEIPKLDKTIRLGIWSYNGYQKEFQNAINNPNIKFVCNSVEGWSEDLEKSLKEIIDTPIEHEEKTLKTCIITVIKNEHRYLDEWIKYHLNLGIDHIFIYEDIDSDSHKEITDKYGSRVSLNNILSILNEKDKEKAIWLKSTHEWNAQHMYFKNALRHLKTNYKYDWCFIIDNDEFITLETGGKNLENILSLYNNYDAVVLKWLCYGANGLINKPDYSTKGLIDIYTKPIADYEYLGATHIKTCYNMNRYKNSFFYNHHHPTDNCNWCNTKFEKDNINTTLDNIYLRHYITKSWEEYVWKVDERGFNWGGNRRFDYFFTVNPDMEPLKDKLMTSLHNTAKETLVVLLYTNKELQEKEIRLTLKSWKKYCLSDYHFVIIGNFNEELKNEFDWIEFIHVPDPININDPCLEIQNKMNTICKLFEDKYNGFIWIADNNYAIKPFYMHELKTIYCHKVGYSGYENAPLNLWKHNKWKTQKLLKEENLMHLNYTTYFPCYFEFSKLKEIWNKYNLNEESFVVEDLYFNSYSHVTPTFDSTIRLGIWDKDIFSREFNNAINNPNIKFICNSTEGWSKELEEALLQIIENN